MSGIARRLAAIRIPRSSVTRPQPRSIAPSLVRSPRQAASCSTDRTSDQRSGGATSCSPPNSAKPVAPTAAAKTALASTTTRELVTPSAQPDEPYDVRHRLSGDRASPSLGQWQLLIPLTDRVEVALLDHMLGAHLASPKPTGSDPAADRLRIPSHATRGLWHRQHIARYYNTQEPGDATERQTTARRGSGGASRGRRRRSPSAGRLLSRPRPRRRSRPVRR